MRLIVRRIALYVITAIVAITINFFLPRLMPGNPAPAVLGKVPSAESPGETVMATQAPVIPLLYGAAWYEYSTRDFTGWPTAANPYIDPVPNSPYLEYTLLHLTPAS